MSSVLYKMIGKHDVSNTIDKRLLWAADTSDPANIVITTRRLFAAADEYFTFFGRPLLAVSCRSYRIFYGGSNDRYS